MFTTDAARVAAPPELAAFAEELSGMARPAHELEGIDTNKLPDL